MSVTIPFCCGDFLPRRRWTCTWKGQQRSKIKLQITCHRNCITHCGSGECPTLDAIRPIIYTRTVCDWIQPNPTQPNGINIISTEKVTSKNRWSKILRRVLFVQNQPIKSFGWSSTISADENLQSGCKMLQRQHASTWCTTICTVLWNWPVKGQLATCYACYMYVHSSCQLCALVLEYWKFPPPSIKYTVKTAPLYQSYRLDSQLLQQYVPVPWLNRGRRVGCLGLRGPRKEVGFLAPDTGLQWREWERSEQDMTTTPVSCEPTSPPRPHPPPPPRGSLLSHRLGL